MRGRVGQGQSIDHPEQCLRHDDRVLGPELGCDLPVADDSGDARAPAAHP